jgi:regulator of sigma E protease
MHLFGLILSLALLSIVYTIGFLTAQILSKAHHRHYFLGFGRGLATFTIKGMKFTLGTFIPILGIAHIYVVDEIGNRQTCYPWQFSHAPIIQRLFATYAGVLSMLVFGLFMAFISVYTSKQTYISKEEVNKHGIYPSAQAAAVGFVKGDKILALNGQDYDNFYTLVEHDIVHDPATRYTILRGNQQIELSLKNIAKINIPEEHLFLFLDAPFDVRDIVPASPADAVGIAPGDRIIRVDGQAVTSSHDLSTHLKADSDRDVTLQIRRGDTSFETLVRLDAENKLGVAFNEKIEYKTRNFTLAQSLTMGAERFFFSVFRQVNGFIKLTFGSVKRIEGPARIVSINGPDKAYWLYSFYTCTGFIVLLNFLPVPRSALFEVVPLVYELLTKKSLRIEAFRRIEKIGIWFLIALVLFIFGNDVFRKLINFRNLNP